MTDKTVQLTSKEWFPCPFCGSPAIESLWPGHRGCSDPTCGAHMANLTMKQWNRRAALETPQPASNEWTRNDCEYDPVGAAREIARLYERAAQETVSPPDAVALLRESQKLYLGTCLGLEWQRRRDAWLDTVALSGPALKASVSQQAPACIWRSGCKHPEVCSSNNRCVPGGIEGQS